MGVAHIVRKVTSMPTQITYKGPPALAGLFAQHLRDEGLEVSYRPPFPQAKVTDEKGEEIE